MRCDIGSFRTLSFLQFSWASNLPPIFFYGFPFLWKLGPRRSRTDAVINGKDISASPMTITLLAFCLTFPQLIVSSIVDPDSPPGSGRSVVKMTA